MSRDFAARRNAPFASSNNSTTRAHSPSRECAYASPYAASSAWSELVNCVVTR